MNSIQNHAKVVIIIKERIGWMKAFFAEFKKFIARGNVMDIAAVINFLLIAFVIFLLIKGLNKLSRKKEAEPAPAVTKICPYCREIIQIGASRCPHCTSKLEENQCEK